jgi:hypothetical protein
MNRGGDVMEYQNFSLIKEDIQADAWGRISLGWAFQNPSVRESLKRGLAEARTGDFAEETVDLDAMLEFAASIPEEVEE